MISKKDIENRTLLFINALEHRKFNVHSGYLRIEETETGKVVAKHPFFSLFAVFVIGHATLTSPILEAFRKKNVGLVILKPNFRIVFHYAPVAEANFLLREKQYNNDNNLEISKVIAENKMYNQVALLKNIRKKSAYQKKAIDNCLNLMADIHQVSDIAQLMGIEGNVSKIFFTTYFEAFDWDGRKPRLKTDYINVILDIGYTFLFNFVECMVRLFGFDVYKGVYHQQWFKRKSLICDLVEPFRCIVDKQVCKSLGLKQFKKSHFSYTKHRYMLKREYQKTYTQTLLKCIVEYKEDIFVYVRDYYRCFMGRKSVPQFPKFYI